MIETHKRPTFLETVDYKETGFTNNIVIHYKLGFLRANLLPKFKISPSKITSRDRTSVIGLKINTGKLHTFHDITSNQ